MVKGDVSPAAAEFPADPGLIILYDPEAVHVALGQPDSPVPQGATVNESLDEFKLYVYNLILVLTPCTETGHALRKCDGGLDPRVQGTVFTELLHRLPADTFREVLEVLYRVFIAGNNPIHRAVAQWSLKVAASAAIPNSLPPNRPLGALIKVVGGVGVGQVTFERVAVTGGIFHVCPSPPRVATAV